MHWRCLAARSSFFTAVSLALCFRRMHAWTPFCVCKYTNLRGERRQPASATKSQNLAHGVTTNPPKHSTLKLNIAHACSCLLYRIVSTPQIPTKSNRISVFLECRFPYPFRCVASTAREGRARAGASSTRTNTAGTAQPRPFAPHPLPLLEASTSAPAPPHPSAPQPRFWKRQHQHPCPVPTTQPVKRLPRILCVDTGPALTPPAGGLGGDDGPLLSTYNDRALRGERAPPVFSAGRSRGSP